MKYTRNCTKCDKTIEHKSKRALNAALQRIEKGEYQGRCPICAQSDRTNELNARMKEFNIYLQNCGNECIPHQSSDKNLSRGNNFIIDHIMEYHHGKKPFPKAVIRHLCANDSKFPNGFTCCNPKHLEWNTQSQNTKDQFIWGRQSNYWGKNKR